MNLKLFTTYWLISAANRNNSVINGTGFIVNHPKLFIGASCRKTGKESAKVEIIDGSQ